MDVIGDGCELVRICEVYRMVTWWRMELFVSLPGRYCEGCKGSGVAERPCELREAVKTVRFEVSGGARETIREYE